MKLRKIVLIETGATDVHVYSRIPIPRLGCVLLGTILRDHGYDVRVYIEDIAPLDWAEVLSADLVGISTLTATAPLDTSTPAKFHMPDQTTARFGASECV